ncbi:MAG TPA: glycosyltransferase family 2 protein [Solirubrobacteraceae bacterium]
MPTASIVVPTRDRASYLAVALDSIVPQAREADAEVLVVLDGPDAASEAVARARGARVVAHDQRLGLNAARNTAVAETSGELIVFLDDDVEVRPGWLAALLRAAREQPDVDVFTGPVFARFEDHAFRTCGREGPPVTFLDLGPDDVDAPHAWGANMAIRRAAFERLGPFTAWSSTAGDEQEWQDRLKASERPRIRYVAGAVLDHRRAGDDARLRSLARAAYARGKAARRFDVFKGTQPTLAGELRTLAGTLVHGPRFRCMNGPVLAAHTLGRVAAALRPAPDPAAPDYLSGRSGTVGGRRAVVRAATDRVLDVLDAPARRRARRAGTPRRSVLVLSIVREANASAWRAAERELRASSHAVTIATAPPGDRGKFENLNALLAAQTLSRYDWVLVVDDDVALPAGFLDAFVALAERFELKLAQPAHRLASHAAWPVTRRRPASLVRETSFVEIGPVTAFHRDAFGVLLPFPPLRMGWGLDVHWSALARERGWRIGVVDATPIGHVAAPAASAYSRADAQREAEAFLAERPYVPRDEADRTLTVHRRL